MKKVVKLYIKDYNIQISNGILQAVPIGISESENKVLKKDFSDDRLIPIESEETFGSTTFKRIMAHEPTTDREENFKTLLEEAIEAKIENFYCTKIDPSLSDDGEKITFEAGKMPAVGKSYNWWEKAAKEFMPERNSRLGTKLQYVSFLGVLMQILVEEKDMSVEDVWNAVCNDSKDLGHYVNSKDAKYKFEYTGSREICGFCDLANVYKILAWDAEDEAFQLAGGYYCTHGNYCPLADLVNRDNRSQDYCFSVGWIVLS